MALLHLLRFYFSRLAAGPKSCLVWAAPICLVPCWAGYAAVCPSLEASSMKPVWGCVSLQPQGIFTSLLLRTRSLCHQEQLFRCREPWPDEQRCAGGEMLLCLQADHDTRLIHYNSVQPPCPHAHDTERDSSLANGDVFSWSGPMSSSEFENAITI